MDVPPIQGDQVREVLKKLKSGKAKGPDGWTPRELEALPPKWTDQLARFYNRWEERGARPPSIRSAVVALIEKPGAKSEAQLRPIGILSYIYRIWMAKEGSSKRLVPPPPRRGTRGSRRHGVSVQGSL